MCSCDIRFFFEIVYSFLRHSILFGNILFFVEAPNRVLLLLCVTMCTEKSCLPCVQKRINWFAMVCLAAYCIWSVISQISKLNRFCTSPRLFCHIPLKQDQFDWDWRMVHIRNMNQVSRTWRVYIGDVTYSYRWRDLIIWGTWLIPRQSQSLKYESKMYTNTYICMHIYVYIYICIYI